MIVWLTSIIGILGTVVGIMGGIAGYRKTRLETKKLQQASTVSEAPPVTTPNDSLISTLALVSKNLDAYRNDVDQARAEVVALKTDLDNCLSEREGGQPDGRVA